MNNGNALNTNLVHRSWEAEKKTKHDEEWLCWIGYFLHHLSSSYLMQSSGDRRVLRETSWGTPNSMQYPIAAKRGTKFLAFLCQLFFLTPFSTCQQLWKGSLEGCVMVICQSFVPESVPWKNKEFLVSFVPHRPLHDARVGKKISSLVSCLYLIWWPYSSNHQYPWINALMISRCRTLTPIFQPCISKFHIKIDQYFHPHHCGCETVKHSG